MERLIELVDQDYQYCLDYASGKTNTMALNNTNRIIRAVADGIRYEARLKADMIAILTEIKLKIMEKSYYDTTIIGNYEDEVRINLVELDDVNEIIIEKINALKEKI